MQRKALITTVFLLVFAAASLYAQNAPSNAETEMSGADYYDVADTNIVYDFSELPYSYTYPHIQYQYANFSPFPYDSGYLRISNEVTNFTKYHNFIANTSPALFFGGIDVYFYQPVRNLSFTTVGANGGTFQIDIYKDRNFYQRRIITAYCGGYPVCFTDLRSENNVSGIIIHTINDSAGLGFDDFSFTLGAYPPTPTPTPTPKPNRSPVGILDDVQTDGILKGWTADPDNQNTSNLVQFYVDGQSSANLVGTIPANVPRAGTGYSGNHGFEFSIPVRFRNGVQHTIYAYGTDLTSGQSATLLTGSPKTFNISPVVQKTEMLELLQGQLTDNPNSGGGRRIFPDKLSPDDNEPRRKIVTVKAKISPAIQGISVHFKAFDMDEPFVDYKPIDTNGSPIGLDNRGEYYGILYCSIQPLTECPASQNSASYATTDNNGEAIVYFSVGKASPGDNFAVAASVNDNLGEAVAIGADISNSAINKTYKVGEDRTEMLTVWRRLHIEIDSMGIVSENYISNTIINKATVQETPVELQVRTLLEPQRFQFGRMNIIGSGSVLVKENTANSVSVFSYNPVPVRANAKFTLYDDDDFNSNNSTTGIIADNGEDVEALADSFNLLQANDDKECGDGYCNVFAPAYIVPEYFWAFQYNTSNIPFVLNANSTNPDLVESQIAQGRNSNFAEDDDFWVVYVQIAYQPSSTEDADPNKERGVTGATPFRGVFVDEVTDESRVPTGSQGSLIFIETVRDSEVTAEIKPRLKTVAHEIGHQFGIAGDGRLFGLMDYTADLMFNNEHLNIIRYRRKSPGIPRN